MSWMSVLDKKKKHPEKRKKNKQQPKKNAKYQSVNWRGPSFYI